MIGVRTVPFVRLKVAGWIGLGSAIQSGCAYRLPVYNQPSEVRLRMVTVSPERYVVRVQAAGIADYPVSSDGRVTIDVPRLPRACSVYLLGLIRISGGLKPLTTKSVHLLDGAKTKATLSLADIAKLPSDASGYQVLTLKR
jgi:hypothetical protein